MAILLILLWLLTCQAEFRDDLQAYEQNCLGEDVFECFDGACISLSEYCDGIVNCGDGSDEHFCPRLQDPQLCNGSMLFLCADGKQCLLNSLVCNNVSDCGDGSDEKNCNFTDSPISNNASCKGFSCDGTKCIPALWACDFKDDCADKTDESVGACSHKIHTYGYLMDMNYCDTVKKLPNGVQKKYKCLDLSYCLSSSMMCDGMVDCRDGSDEGTFCDTWHTMCSSNPCKGNNTTCVPERNGFFCICDEKTQEYNYTTNQCEHIHECATARPYCSHTCQVNKTGIECLCDKGYTADTNLCFAEGPEAMLFYSTQSEIGYITLKTKKHVTVATGIKQTHGVAFDGQYVYWVETSQGHQAIMRAEMENVTGTKQVLVSLGLEEPGDIALDWMGGHIYFSDAERGIIAVCRNDGSMCATLPVNAKNPKFVTLAVKYGKMFWADWHQKPVIMTAQMDGSGSELLLDDLRNFATGLTMDVPNNRLYYVDHTIKVIKIDDRQTYTLLIEPYYHPYAIAVFENTVYWSDIISHSIETTDKLYNNGKGRGFLMELNSTVFDMHIYHPILIGQFDQASPCVYMSCSHLCLLTSDVTGMCACPDGMRLNGTTCDHIKEFGQSYLIIGAGREFTRVQYNALGNPETHTTRIDMGRVEAMAYDNVRDTLYIYDGLHRTIDSIKMSDFSLGVTQNLLYSGLMDVVDMDYDHATDSLYILDAGGFIEVVSLRTRQRTFLYHFMVHEEPLSFCIMPEYGKMLIAIRKNRSVIIIDSMGLNGEDRKRVMTNAVLGTIVRLRYSYYMDSVYIADDYMLDFVNPEGEGRENFLISPASIASLQATEAYLFWTDRHTPRLFWADIHDVTHRIRRIELPMFHNNTRLHIQATRPAPSPNSPLTNHPCLHNKCSDICVQLPHPRPDPKKEITLGYECRCPPTLLLIDDKCVKMAKCKHGEIYCHQSNDCASEGKRCDGNKDCKYGEDEEFCHVLPVVIGGACAQDEISCNGSCIDKKLSCNSTEHQNETIQCEAIDWLCKSGTLCVERSQVCDGNHDCPDGSDEAKATCDILTCQDQEFMCTAGYCILEAFRCDGELDCGDGSDEENCGNKTCTVGHFQCRNMACIELHKRCDGQNDCIDSSDEDQCEESVPEEMEVVTHCAKEEYACALNTSICLPATARCNWKVDCPGGTDEDDCDHHCAPRGKFKCAQELKCIARNKVCDGKNECSDGSDETTEACLNVNRTSYHHYWPMIWMPACTNGYLCGTGDCLEWRRVCDSVVDCYDGSDEKGNCKSACQSTVCSHICQPTPKGPRCSCPQGLKLLDDNRTCVDVDECADDVCSQNCHNVPGTFLCSCHHGYTLRANRRSCKAVEGTMSILYVSENTVRSLSPDGNSVLEYNDPNIATIGGIDANIREHKLYVTEPDAGKLIQVNGRNSSDNVTVVTNIGTPTKVAVDWMTGNVYFVDNGKNANNSCIRVCNMDKKKCAMMQQTSLSEGLKITALVIDPASRRMFYCARHEGVSVVWSLSLSGRTRTDLGSFGKCTGLAVDSFKRRLYVAETGPARITRMDLFGDRQTVVLSYPHLEAPQGLVIFEDWVYFLTKNAMKLSRCRLYGINPCEPFMFRVFDANAFVIRHPSVQRNDLTNVCADYVCSDICVLDDTGPQCLCHDGSIAKDGNCEGSGKSLEPAFDGLGPGYSRVSEVTITVTAAILFLLALYLAIFVYYRCVDRRNRENNYVEVRFQNTSSSATDVGPVIEMPTNAISSGVASGASTAAAHEFVNPLQYFRDMYRSHRRTTRPIGTAGLEISVPNMEPSSDTESDLDDRDTLHIVINKNSRHMNL